MMQSRKLGSADLFQIIELHGPTHDADWMLPGMPPADLQANAAWLYPDFWIPRTNRLVFTFQLWVLKTGRSTIVIDTGIGNHKQRQAHAQNMINTPVLDWLAAIGAPREEITHVVHTHLHGDHVGWNTSLVDGAWLPTFPNATYYLPKHDWEAFKERYDAGVRDLHMAPIADSVLPIVEAGLAAYVTPGEVVADCLIASDSSGHTPGHLLYTFADGGDDVIFCGDVLHSPMQVLHPEINCRWCEAPDLARASRIALLKRAAQSGATLFPAHAKGLNGWRIGTTSDGFSVHV